jgi:ribosomal protein L14E/L6E/L27E
VSHTKEMNDEKVRIYRQKVKSFCYSAIITRSNITKIAFKLARYLTNLNSNHVKATNHCIRYLHATKYLAIRYSNSEDEKLNNQISSSNKETTLSLSNKEMKSSHSKLNRFSHSKLNKNTSSNKKSKQIFEKTANAFFANDLDQRNAENYIFKLFDDIID